MFITLLWTLGPAVLWLMLSVVIDRSNARREHVSAVSPAEIVVVLAVAVAGTLSAPAPERVAVGIALAGIGIAACGDVHHGYLWEEISVPTLFFALAAGAYFGIAPDAVAGMVLLGAVALAVYFLGQVRSGAAGFGDVIPTATIGAAVGPLAGLGAFGIACAAFAIAALVLGKRFGVALPFGPAIASAIVIGAIGSSLLSFGGQ